MRPPVNADRIRELVHQLAQRANEPVTLYITGGGTAVIEGWRNSTVDIDLRFEPEIDVMLRDLPKLKEQLGINIEFASPTDFIPELPGWRERSPLVFSERNVEVRHFDLYSQALSKIERGFEQDLVDVQEMITRKLVEPTQLSELYEAVEQGLYKYPAIDPKSFRAKVENTLNGLR